MSDKTETPPSETPGEKPGEAKPPEDKKDSLLESYQASKTSEERDKLFEKVLSELRTSNHESMTRRQELQELKKWKSEQEKAENDKKKAEMTDLERAKTEKEELTAKLSRMEHEKMLSDAKFDFMRVGSKDTDIDTLLLYWEKVSPEEREKTTPEKWANELKKTKPHLFGGNILGDSDPNPNKDKKSGSEDKPKVPSSVRDIKQLMRKKFG